MTTIPDHIPKAPQDDGTDGRRSVSTPQISGVVNPHITHRRRLGGRQRRSNMPIARISPGSGMSPPPPMSMPPAPSLRQKRDSLELLQNPMGIPPHSSPTTSLPLMMQQQQLQQQHDTTDTTINQSKKKRKQSKKKRSNNQSNE